MKKETNMETELLGQINEVLSRFSVYWGNGELLKNKIIEDLRDYDEQLIEALLSNELIKDTYSISMGSTIIFKIEDFISMLLYMSYWDNSYTKYIIDVCLIIISQFL